MGYWNYRVVEKYNHVFKEVDVELHEVYYDKDGIIQMWSENPVSPSGVSLEDLKEDITNMIEALDKPILKESELPSSEDFLKQLMSENEL